MRHHRMTLCSLLLVLTLGLALGDACIGDELWVRARRDGRLRVWEGTDPLLTLELNAHALKWLNVSQRDARIDERGAADPITRTYVGCLTVPGESGGALAFSELSALDVPTPMWPFRLIPRRHVEAPSSTLTTTYDLRSLDPTTLCGLQISVNLEARAYQGAVASLTGVRVPKRRARAFGARGREVDVSELVDGDPVTVKLPATSSSVTWQLFDGYCSEIAIEGGKGAPITIRAPEACHFMIQDNRRWGHDVFEVRLAFIMDAEGKEISAGDEYRGELALEFSDSLRFIEPLR